MTHCIFVLHERAAGESMFWKEEANFGGRYIWTDGKTDHGSPSRLGGQQLTVFNHPFSERAARKDAVELLDDFRLTVRIPHPLRRTTQLTWDVHLFQGLELFHAEWPNPPGSE